MKVLSIGNSFSEDAQNMLHDLALFYGEDIYCENLFIGGCSLWQHYNNLMQNKKDYELQINGRATGNKTSIADALASENWDTVTLQQASGLSGRPQSYFPYITALADAVRAALPGVRLMFHKTWAYDKGSTHPDFAAYNCDREEMHRRLSDAAEMAAAAISAEIIPTGDAIRLLRCNPLGAFADKKGISLCRDGFHLSTDAGRYTASAVWLKTFTGIKLCGKEYQPASGGGVHGRELIKEINYTVDSMFSAGK